MLSLTLNITKNVVEWVFGILSSASCGPNWSDEAASTAADDDLIRVKLEENFQFMKSSWTNGKVLDYNGLTHKEPVILLRVWNPKAK